MAAIICIRTDEQIYKEVLAPGFHKRLNVTEWTFWQRMKHFMQYRSLFDIDDWYRKAVDLIGGSYTFLEAYQKTGRILNISVVPDEPNATSKQLNYITAPDVIIASAVIASSAVPGLLNPVELLMKTKDGDIVPFHGSGRRWRDGSLTTDIPERELHMLFEVNYTIVSQTNPHIVLFFFERNGSAGSPPPHRAGKGWRGGFLASALTQYIKLDLKKWLYFIRDLDLLPKFLDSDMSQVFLQRFEGNVTIVPRTDFNDYINIINDPDERRMKRYVSHGQIVTWPKLGMISNRMKIEQTLTNILESLKKEVYN
jgi:predicted acylesterase/phospholipase RssA